MGDEAFTVLRCTLGLHQHTSVTGFPRSITMGEPIVVTIEATRSDTPFCWAASHTMPKSGSITFYDSTEGKRKKKVEFAGAYCVGHAEGFGHIGGPMAITLHISAQKIRVGDVEFIRNWLEEAEYYSEMEGNAANTYQPPAPVVSTAPLAILSSAYEADAMKREHRFNAKGERIITPKELKSFKKEMAEIGVKVELDIKGKVLKGYNVAGYDSKTKTLYLKKPPSIYEAAHESHHARQHNKLGDEAYNNQSRLEKEQYVRDELMKSKDLLTPQQINHADAYIKYVEDGYWPPKNPKTGLYIL